MQDSNPKPQVPTKPIIVAAVIAPVSFVIKMLLTPDPISMIIATVLIFVAMFRAYLFGFPNGKKQ